MRVPSGRGLVLLWRRCDTLCTSGFVDDVTIGGNGTYGTFQHRAEFDVCECLVTRPSLVSAVLSEADTLVLV